MTAATGIEIRIAEKKDAELVADLSRRTFYDSFARYNTEENMRLFQDRQFTREMQMAEVGKPGRIFLLAYIGEEPVGYASMREDEPPGDLAGARAMEIHQIYSGQKTIGKGVGQALMEACLDLARKKGMEWVWLGVWEKNARAIAFYTKCGFHRFGEHIFMVGLDAQTDWYMKKPLSPATEDRDRGQ